MLNKKNTW